MGKRIIFSVLLLLCLVTSGCFLALLSDPNAYGFRGTIRNSLNREVIAGVTVGASCKKTRLDPPLETVSDGHGSFFLHGFYVGFLDDCELSFKHPGFESKVIKLSKTRDFSYEGAAYVWDLDVELEPN
ncbi:MAG: hypothetical protein ACLQVJ_27295 [Syntrophobacteraceae bacterium]